MKAIRGHWIFSYHSSPCWLMTGSLTEPLVELTVSKSNSSQVHYSTVVTGLSTIVVPKGF